MVKFKDIKKVFSTFYINFLKESNLTLVLAQFNFMSNLVQMQNLEELFEYEEEEEEEDDENKQNIAENEEDKDDEGKNKDFTLTINDNDYIIDKKAIKKASSVIRDHIKNDPDCDTFSIEIEGSEGFESIIPTFFTKNPALIDKYNYSFLRNFSEKLQISELHSKIENFTTNLTILKESEELKDLIDCEKIIFSINETNLEEKVTESLMYFERENSNKTVFLRSLYFATKSYPDQLTVYFDFMARLESESIFVFEEYSKFPLKELKRSETPSLFLENCNEICFIILKLIEYGIISEQDVLDLKICLPKIFSHIDNQDWVQTLQKNGLSNSYFRSHFNELSENDWELHKKLAYEGNDVNPIVEIIKNDDFDAFQNLSSQTKFNLKEEIEMTFYLKNSFLKKASLIEISAFYSAIKIFKFLIMSNVTVSSNLAEYAVAGGNFEIIHICEDYNCDFKNTPQIAIRFHRNDIFYWLIESKGIFEFIKNPCDLLENCARYGNYSIMKKLIKLGVDPSTLVSDLICFRQPDVAKIILKLKGIDVNVADKKSKATPLHFAGRRKMVDIVQILLNSNDIDVNAKAEFDTLPIHSAFRSKIFDVVKLLLDRDDIKIDNCKTIPPDNHDKIALHAAARKGNLLIVKMLIAHPMCIINSKNFVLFNFIYYILLCFFYGILFICFNFGVLHCACSSSSTELVEFLLKCPFFDINERAILIFMYFYHILILI